jgi:2-(1,2-epoxy-1,2-dihydrophenyl)acetyl-CoA isomerase
MGMLYKVYDNEEFAGASRALTAVLAQLPTQALALTKHAFNYSANNTLEEQLTLEDELQQKAALTKDYKEGVTAFLEKRPALFRGE